MKCSRRVSFLSHYIICVFVAAWVSSAKKATRLCWRDYTPRVKCWQQCDDVVVSNPVPLITKQYQHQQDMSKDLRSNFIIYISRQSVHLKESSSTGCHGDWMGQSKQWGDENWDKSQQMWHDPEASLLSIKQRPIYGSPSFIFHSQQNYQENSVTNHLK